MTQISDAMQDEILAAICAALQPRRPPEDARSADQIAEALGITKQRAYEIIGDARKAGIMEKVGRFGKLTYYRLKTGTQSQD
jgi:predicted transcriptional regulator